MIKVFQQVICKENGDCWRACIASILEMKSDDVPNFVALAGKRFGEDPHALALEWLRERGVALLECHGRDPKDAFNWRMLPGVFCILSVPSQKFPKECTHAVVGQWREHPENPDCTQIVIVHDPNPGNKPYPVDVKINGITYLVPMRPKLGQRIDAMQPDGKSPYSAKREPEHGRATAILAEAGVQCSANRGKIPTKTEGGSSGSKSACHNKPASVKEAPKKSRK